MRRLAGAGHLAGPQLVQDLARLGVVPRVVGGRLEAGEDRQRLDRDDRVERDQLERGDDAVAAEQRREPRDPGGEVRLALGRPVVRGAGPGRASERRSVRSRNSWSDAIRGASSS